MGGEAVVNGDNVADWDGAHAMVRQAVDTFGDLHMLVNNAGILRDRVIVNMTEAEWDAVVTVHLKGHFCPPGHAAVYWREQTKAREWAVTRLTVRSSTRVDFGAFLESRAGQLRRGQDGHRHAVADLREGALRYGVRSNAIAPERAPASPKRPGIVGSREGARGGRFDVWDPANVSPFVAYLATADCPFTGETFLVQGGTVQRVQSWSGAEKIEKDDRWSIAELAQRAGELHAQK